MPIDLAMLTASALLTGVLTAGKGIAMWMYWPVSEVLGNRDATPPLPAWAWRADRAHRNMLENFPHFAALVLLTNLAGLANPLTALGATIFFWARLAHAVLYISGVWRLRWIAFFARVARAIAMATRRSAPGGMRARRSGAGSESPLPPTPRLKARSSRPRSHSATRSCSGTWLPAPDTPRRRTDRSRRRRTRHSR